MRFLPTRAHAVLDYLTAVVLFLLPQMLAETEAVRMLFWVAGGGLLVISLLTRYELGAFKVLPMRAHLTLDFLLGLVFLGFALLRTDEPGPVRAILAVIGIFEIGAALCTYSRSPLEAPEAGTISGAAAHTAPH